MNIYRSLLIIAITPLLLSSGKRDKQVSAIGKEVQHFSLPGADGKIISTGSYAHAKGFIIVFTCNHCPFAKLYTARLNALNTKYKKLGVPLLAINPMDTLVYEDEGIGNMRKWARSQRYNFPYLQDGAQSVAKMFYAQHTPQAYVIWKEKEKWIIKYSGAIDDNGQHPELAKPFAGNAVDELLQGKQPSTAETVSLGCSINYR